MRNFVRSTALTLGLVGTALTVSCSSAFAATTPNVDLYYGTYYPSTELVNTNTVFTGSSWQNTGTYGSLVTSTKQGMTYVQLHLTRGTKALWAYVDYGTVSTPTFSNEKWDGKGAIPLYKTLTAKNGQKYSIRLSSVFVGGFNKHLPEPPAKGGCDDVVISCGK
jgi:ABC-type oligopeptide transport system substrate-binding subunit